MNTAKTRFLPAALLLLPLAIACSPGKKADAGAATTQKSDTGMAGMAGMDGMSAPVTIPKGSLYTVADVHFMQGMIAHHAQAIFMARMAASHKANARLLKFAQKIDQSQRAEILLMQDWLTSKNQTAPDTASYHTVMMPGMLTAEQIKQLEAARGAEFDKQFLVLMIQHHEGALKMVDDLLNTPQAAQDVAVSVFANDVTAVQSAEITLMHKMLAN